MPTERQKIARDKWDRENTTVLGCKVRRDYAERVKQKAKEHGTNVNAILLKALRDFMSEDDNSSTT